MDRAAQHELLAWTLEALDGSVSGPPPLDELRLRPALLTTGLGALVATLAEEQGVAFDAATADHLAEQRRAVATRHQRYMSLAPELLEALDAAGVAATPVKGIVLTSVGIWSRPLARPMADIDLLVPAADRARCGPVLEGHGLQRVERVSTEDVYLAWGDGGVGRTDGESAHHNGKVEIHPGWAEQLHGYAIGHDELLAAAERRQFVGTRARMLPDHALVAHVIGHLSACVIRRDVRAINVLDVVFALRWLTPASRRALTELLAGLDPRLAVPGLWLVDRYAPDTVGAAGLTPQLDRLPARAVAELGRTAPHDVLRDGDVRSPWTWRSAFARTAAERAAVARELVLPPTHQIRRGDPTASLLTLHGRRVRRALGRLTPGAAAR